MNSRFIISDTHMADGGPRDNFEIDPRREQRLLNFCDYVQDRRGRLIIDGDAFEFWQTNAGAVLYRRRRVIERFGEMGARLIVGNHDGLLAPLESWGGFRDPFLSTGLWGPTTEEIGDRRFKFIHGHEFDSFNSAANPSWGTMLAIFAGIVEDLNGSPVLSDGSLVEERLSKLGQRALGGWRLAYEAYRLTKWLFGGGSELKAAPNPQLHLTATQVGGRLAEHLLAASKMAMSEEVDVMVCGHTHIRGHFSTRNLGATRREESVPWYYNAGSWTWNECPFLEIDEDGVVREFLWTGTRAVLSPKEIRP